MSLKESGEMYLETVYVLSETKGKVRSVDVAEFMNFTKPSVSRGLGLLKASGYITVDNQGFITLTSVGAQKAENIFERHTVITNMLKAIGVEESIAAEDACRIEHIISDETFEKLKKHFEKLN